MNPIAFLIVAFLFLVYLFICWAMGVRKLKRDNPKTQKQLDEEWEDRQW